MTSSHPLTDPGRLGVSPVVGALIALFAVVAVVALVPAGRSLPVPRAGAVPRPAWSRVLGVTGLILLTAAGFSGSPDEARNPATLVVVYLAWPGLLLLAAAGLRVWPRIDPFDSLGAAADRLAGGSGPDPRHDVRPAVVAAFALVAFLSAYALLVPPEVLATALVLYAVAVTALAIAGGRDRAARFEVVGLLLGWAGLLRRNGLVGWVPPSGAPAVLGVLLGGLAFSRLRRTGLWGPAAVSDHPELWTALGVVGAAAAGALLVAGLAALGRRHGSAGGVEAALVPAVVSVAVAYLLRRSLTAAQLLPQVLADPLGSGSGRWTYDVDPNLGGTAAQQGAALAVVLLGHLLGALVLVRRSGGARQRLPAVVALGLSAVVAAALVLAA